MENNDMEHTLYAQNHPEAHARGQIQVWVGSGRVRLLVGAGDLDTATITPSELRALGERIVALADVLAQPPEPTKYAAFFVADQTIVWLTPSGDTTVKHAEAALWGSRAEAEAFEPYGIEEVTNVAEFCSRNDTW